MRMRRYVTVMGNHVIDPVITASSAGSGVPTGVLATSLVGPDYHLSPVWTPINMQLGAHNCSTHPHFTACKPGC